MPQAITKRDWTIEFGDWRFGVVEQSQPNSVLHIDVSANTGEFVTTYETRTHLHYGLGEFETDLSAPAVTGIGIAALIVVVTVMVVVISSVLRKRKAA